MSDLDNALARLALMQKDAVSGSDAVVVSFYAQEAPLYWTNTVNGFVVELESEALQVITYRITMTLILATTTEGWNTEAEQKVHTYLPLILQYFGQRRQLKRTSADDPVPFLDPRGSLVTGGSVSYGGVNSGVGQGMFGIDIQIEVPMYQQTEQVIF